MVMAGKDVGLTGTIQKVIRSKNRVIVEGRNLVRLFSVFSLSSQKHPQFGRIW